MVPLVPEIRVLVVWSTAPRMVREAALTLPAGCTFHEALQLLGQGPLPWPDAPDLSTLVVSLWGRKVSPTQVLLEGDRLELCRALKVDPKRARQQRFRQQGTQRAGLFAKRRPGAAAGY